MRICLMTVTAIACIFLTSLIGAQEPELPDPIVGLTDLTLVMDGSSDPPGDRLDIRVADVRHQGQIGEPVTLHFQVRAYRITNSNDDSDVVATPVEAAGERNRDEQGRFRIDSYVDMTADNPMLEHRLVVPYADLELPFGRHRIGYEVSCYHREVPQWITATRQTGVAVTDGTRTSMIIRRRVYGAIEEPVTLVVTDDNGKVVEVETTRTIERSNEVPELASVSIQGDFTREELGTAGGPVAVKPYQELRNRPVYFATNRNIENPNARDHTRFGNERSDEVTYGSCRVHIPNDEVRRRGSLRRGGWWSRKDANQVFHVEALNTIQQEAFLRSMRSNDVLVYVHGFNNSFEDAVLRLAQVGYDLKFPGRLVAFCWASAGTASLGSYRKDETTAKVSVGQLTKLLEGLAKEAGEDRHIHIIAHSMGNRILLRAIHNLEQRWQNDATFATTRFGHLVFAAPDVDRATFDALLPAAENRSLSTTLYYCEHDRALQLSQGFNVNKRVGQGPPCFGRNRLHNIDANNATTDVIGIHHTYFAKNILLVDLSMLLLDDLTPDKRRTVQQVDPPMLPPYMSWRFP